METIPIVSLIQRMGSTCRPGLARASNRRVSDEIRTMEGKGRSLPVVSTDQVYKTYWEVSMRRVQHPNGQKVDYQLAGHPISYHYVVVFPFHSNTKKVTIIRQGLNEWWFQFPTGGHNPKKANSFLSTARFELSEEAHLTNGT
ncbi:hypothetical protein AAMO2058_001457000 [Amorphochlora amoebiformis]